MKWADIHAGIKRAVAQLQPELLDSFPSVDVRATEMPVYLNIHFPRKDGWFGVLPSEAPKLLRDLEHAK